VWVTGHRPVSSMCAARPHGTDGFVNPWRILGASAALAWCCSAYPIVVHADGAMVVGQRVLFRTGPSDRGYCDIPSAECDTVLTKVLSGYGYLRGALRSGVSIAASDRGRASAFGALHLDGVSAALPGGDLAVARLDAVLGQSSVERLRLTLIDLENAFGCMDAQRGNWVLPILGMTSRQCRRDAIVGVDVRIVRLQWDAYDGRLLAEWLSAGPAFELLVNGLSQAHLRRSLVLAVPFDVQSQRGAAETQSSGTSIGAGVRLSALYRTPQWESRLGLRHRTTVAGREHFGREHSVEGELRLLRNWFLSDALAMQAGLSLAFSWASRPWFAQALLATRSTQLELSAGLYLGWVSEAPGI
jgi:hypothetical protein